MDNIKELEKYAKEIGLLNPDESLNGHYRYWEIASTWKANEIIKLVQQWDGHEKFNSVLEVGCGYGMILQKISEHLQIPHVVGIDNHEPTLKMAKRISPNCTYIVGDAYNLSFCDNSFDLVILSDIIEHLEHPKLLLQEAKRVAKYSAFKIPLEKSLSTIGRQYGPQDSSGHLFALDETAATKLIDRAGFQIQIQNTPRQPKILDREKRFNRFGFIAPLLPIITKFLRYMPYLYDRIFGKSLFIFCKNK